MDLYQLVKRLISRAKEVGVEVSPKDGGLKFSDKVTPELKENLSKEFDRLVDEQAEAFKMSRRDFLKSPLVASAGMMALSAGLGMSLVPSSAEAGILDPIAGSVETGYPMTPLSPLDFGALDQVDPSGLNAVVVGGSRGIGKQTAEKLAAAGFNVIATSRNPKTVVDPPVGCTLLQLDLAKKKAGVKFAKILSKLMPSLNLLVLNAGRFFIGRTVSSDPLKVDEMWKTNVAGHMELIKYLEPMFPSSGYARVLFASSLVDSFYAFPFGDGHSGPGNLLAPYMLSKSAMHRNGMIFDAEMKNALADIATYPGERHNIKVSTLHPIVVNTDIIQHTIFGDDPSDQLIVDTRDYWAGVVAGAGIDASVPGEAYLQMALLEEPFLCTYIVDQTLLPSDPRMGLQIAALTWVAYQEAQTIRSV